MERSSAARLTSTFKVLDKDLFLNLYLDNQFVGNLILDKFKEFLNDDYFEDIERQITLFRFLQLCYPIEIYSDVVKFIEDECILKDDYLKVLLEWKLNYSDFIKASKLSPLDGEELSYSIQEKISYDNIIKPTNHVDFTQVEKILNDLGIELKIEEINGQEEN